VLYVFQSHAYDNLLSFGFSSLNLFIRASVVVSTCSDQQDMETQIVTAFDKVKENIERQREKMKRAGMPEDDM
jgi:hypothetical protein